MSTKAEVQRQYVIMMARIRACRGGESYTWTGAGNKHSYSTETVSRARIKDRAKSGFAGAVTKRQDLPPIWDSLVCEYRLLSLPSFTQPTIHRAPSLAFAASIISKPLHLVRNFRRQVATSHATVTRPASPPSLPSFKKHGASKHIRIRRRGRQHTYDSAHRCRWGMVRRLRLLRALLDVKLGRRKHNHVQATDSASSLGLVERTAQPRPSVVPLSLPRS